MAGTRRITFGAIAVLAGIAILAGGLAASSSIGVGVGVPLLVVGLLGVVWGVWLRMLS